VPLEFVRGLVGEGDDGWMGGGESEGSLGRGRRRVVGMGEFGRGRKVCGREGLCGGGSGTGRRVWWIGRFSSWSDLLWKSLLGIASADFPRECNEMTNARYPPPPPQNGANF